MQDNNYLIELDRVSVRKRGQLILSELSLEMSQGLTALLGRNGAGKTTLMRMLAGVQKPTSGSIKTSSGQLYNSSRVLNTHLSVMGWVPQGPGYPGGMRVDRLVEYAAWLKRVPARARHDAALSALEACNAAELSTRTIKSLSGGERQRVILASAVVGDPQFLLLDEPTTGLDPAQRESYLAMLKRLSQTTTVLYSSHLVDDVVRTASRVLVLDRGRISADLAGADLEVPADQLGDTLRQAVILSMDRNAAGSV
ncbi:ATP-binding cassette domain-containing protein [uncultured Arthrobacter sp.]|uniref:ATP-binding cassette domain-containing protein n=1 Tax=uncultured Arthrobacter sp. TaxID=114050 RepID=UPI00262FA98F|nr:ATP-binding cassette domain-containing protein [uncultured Arthrobacter sp.]